MELLQDYRSRSDLVGASLSTVKKELLVTLARIYREAQNPPLVADLKKIRQRLTVGCVGCLKGP